MRGLNFYFLLLFSLIYVQLTEEVTKEALLYRQLVTICVVKKICKGENVFCLLFPVSYGILCLFYAKHSEYS